jgi:thiosulfate dehydrogenase [quinone] large subunit
MNIRNAIRSTSGHQWIYGILRVSMGIVFLWAFFDKTLGLGYATEAAQAWIRGGSPTYGFLIHGTHGPLASFFQSLAGLVWVDWSFMLGLAFVGISMLTGRGIKWGAIIGSVMLLLMWLAALPPENNPLIDDHIVYILVFVLLAHENKSVRQRA